MLDILLINKPKGITSFDVIRILRKKLGIKKMGHAGTLDPMASGLLIVGVGSGTKKLKKFLNLSKIYKMEILLGKKTDTGDVTGEVIEEKKVGEIKIPKLKKVLKNLEGEITLTAPLYSAIKLKGKPLYKYAREGIKIKPPKRKTEIFYLKLLDCQKEIISPPLTPPISSGTKQGEKKCEWILTVEMKCSKGTYARSVAEKIGEELGYPATLNNLIRTRIGEFDLTTADDLKT